VKLLGWLWWLPCALACGERSRAATHPACLVFSNSLSSLLPLVLSVGLYCLWQSRMNFKRLSPLFQTRGVLRTCTQQQQPAAVCNYFQQLTALVVSFSPGQPDAAKLRVRTYRPATNMHCVVRVSLPPARWG
jgi:hypothetical protein